MIFVTVLPCWGVRYEAMGTKNADHWRSAFPEVITFSICKLSGTLALLKVALSAQIEGHISDDAETASPIPAAV